MRGKFWFMFAALVIALVVGVVVGSVTAPVASANTAYGYSSRGTVASYDGTQWSVTPAMADWGRSMYVEVYSAYGHGGNTTTGNSVSGSFSASPTYMSIWVYDYSNGLNLIDSFCIGSC